MRVRLAVVALCLLMASCAVSAERAIHAAETSGLADVVDRGSSGLSACSDSDLPLGRIVAATNANGQRIEAAVG